MNTTSIRISQTKGRTYSGRLKELFRPEEVQDPIYISPRMVPTVVKDLCFALDILKLLNPQLLKSNNFL